jgi:hypothetical protein
MEQSRRAHVSDTSDQILEQIEHEREALGENLHRLEGTIKRSLNVRAFVEEHPRDALVIALGTGFFLASLIGGKPQHQRAPEARRMNETLSLTGSALLSLGMKQFQEARKGVNAGMQS